MTRYRSGCATTHDTVAGPARVFPVLFPSPAWDIKGTDLTCRRKCVADYCLGTETRSVPEFSIALPEGAVSR